MMAMDPIAARRIRQAVEAFPDIQLAYLFGSRVSGDVGALSDYDVAILLDRTADGPAVRSQLAHEVAQSLDSERVDVVLLNRAPIELAYAVIASGQLLYQRDVATRVEYEADVLSRYGDYLPVLRAQRSALLGETGNDQRVQRYRETLRRTERTLGEIKAAAGEASR
jgi:predicted nucleotidyltransferase